MNANIKKSNDLTAIIKANDKLNKLGEKFLTPKERELVDSTADICNINRDSIIFLILFNNYGLTAKQLNELYTEATKTANDEANKNIEYFYKLNAQCQELKEKGVDIVKLYKGG